MDLVPQCPAERSERICVPAAAQADGGRSANCEILFAKRRRVRFCIKLGNNLSARSRMSICTFRCSKLRQAIDNDKSWWIRIESTYCLRPHLKTGKFYSLARLTMIRRSHRVWFVFDIDQLDRAPHSAEAQAATTD